MHARLPNNFRHINVFEALKDVSECDILFIVSVDGRKLSFKASVVSTKDIMGQSLIRFQYCTFNELVILQLAVFICTGM